MNGMLTDPALKPARDVRAGLLDEYLELKEKLGPLEKRLEDVRDRLRDLVTEEGHFVDEIRGVIVRVEPRFRKEYDAERLQVAFPRLSACVQLSVNVAQLEACLRAGMVTEGELNREGVLTRALHSRALIVKSLGGNRKSGEIGDAGTGTMKPRSSL